MTGGNARLLIDQRHIPVWKFRLKLGVGLDELRKIDGDWSDGGVVHWQRALAGRMMKAPIGLGVAAPAKGRDLEAVPGSASCGDSGIYAAAGRRSFPTDNDNAAWQGGQLEKKVARPPRFRRLPWQPVVGVANEPQNRWRRIAYRRDRSAAQPSPSLCLRTS